MILKNIFPFMLLLLVVQACDSDPLDVDASDIKVEIEFMDVRKPILEADSAQLITKHHEYKKELGELYDYLIGYCFRIGDVADTAFLNSIRLYRKDDYMKDVEAEINKEFPSMTQHEGKILNGFRHLKFHLPEVPVPKKIAYINSLYRSSVFCTEKEIGIGLERYLGPENRITKKLDPLSFFEYVKKGMDPKYMERDVLSGWIATNVVDEVEGNLAERMIMWGKIAYLTEAAFPEESKALILRYNEDELKWAEENELAFWKYLVDEKLLFDSNERNAMNMLNPGPTTSGLPIQGSPDRMGVYLGWQMVRNYVEVTGISMKDLLDKPYNDILQEYKTVN